MAGTLNRHGDFGEIREGWVADLLLHEGELLEDLAGLADPESNLALIMKDGKIIKKQALKPAAAQVPKTGKQE